MSGPVQGTLTVSVDLPIGTSRFPTAAGELLRRLSDLGLPATWAVDAVASPAVEAILQSRLQHEIALSTANMASAATPRKQLAQHLVRARIAAARDGVSLSTLAIHGSELDESHYDLMVKHEFSMLRLGLNEPTASGPPQTLRYGVWKAPLSAVVAAGSGGLVFGAAAKCVRALRQAVSKQGFVHVGIDAGAEQTSADRKGVERLLAKAAQLRDAKQLSCQTLQQVAADLKQRGQRRRSAGSVLRAA